MNLLVMELNSFDSTKCSLDSDCNGKGTCENSYQYCICEEGYYLKDCSMETNSADFNNLIDLKKDIYNLLSVFS
jgi:hypothetical protein